MVMALIEHAEDRDPEVRRVIIDSLCDVGRHQWTLVLSSCETFLTRNKKISLEHRITLLQAMKVILDDTVAKVPEELAARLVILAAAEMTFKQVHFRAGEGQAGEGQVARGKWAG